MEYGSSISLAMVHSRETELDLDCLKATTLDHYIYRELNLTNLKDIDPMLPDRMGGESLLTYVQFKTDLAGIGGDIIIPPLQTIKKVTYTGRDAYSLNKMELRIANTYYTLITEGYQQNRIICLDGSSHSIAWIHDPQINGYIEQRAFLPFDDRKTEYYPVFFEKTCLDTTTGFEREMKMTRLDPETGKIIWSTELPGQIEGANVIRTITDHEGSEHILVGDRSNFFIVNLQNGDLEKDYWRFWSTTNSAFDIVDTPVGDKIIFVDNVNYYGYCFDPFAPGLPGRWGHSGLDLEKKDMVISWFNTTILKAFYLNGVLYGGLYSTPYNGSFNIVNLETGRHVQWFKHDPIPDIRDLVDVYDHNGDGSDEMIFVGRLSSFGMNNVKVIAYDLLERSVLWELDTTATYYGENTPCEIIDWGGDGGRELIITGGSIPRGHEIGNELVKVHLISLARGILVWEDTTTINPLYELYHGKDVISILLRDQIGNYHVRDHNIGGYLEAEISLNERGEKMVYFMDLDGDGLKEILEIETTSRDQIRYADPYRTGKVLTETMFVGGYPLTTVNGGPTGDCVVIQSKSVLMWITGDIDEDKEPVEPLIMDQREVILYHGMGTVPPPPEVEVKNEGEEPEENTTVIENETGQDPNSAVNENYNGTERDETGIEDPEPSGDTDEHTEEWLDDDHLVTPDNSDKEDTTSGPILLISMACIILLMVIIVLIYPVTREKDR
jgi:hypothetical protein